MTKHKFNAVQKLIFEMLTTSTGSHFLDSGFDNGRHWQRNQKKTIFDFYNEKPESIIYDYNYFERTVSVFHYLGFGYLELDNVCKKFNRLNKNVPDWLGEIDNQNVYGVCESAANYLNGLNAEVVHTFNTYNYDSDLSQVIQGSQLNINNEYYYLIQIHQGADVRGGYTDAKLFYCTDCCLSDLSEYKSQSEIIDDIKYGYLDAYNNLGELLKLDFTDNEVVIL